MAVRSLATPLLVALLLAAASYACATVADLDVTDRPPEARPAPTDDDDAAAADAEGRVDASPGVDAGSDAHDDSALPVPPTACSCALDQGCCVPATGAGVCGPATGGASCKTGGGIFLRCAGSDIANGRSCCFGQGSTETFYAAACTDGGQVCVDSSECATGTCQTITCRSVSLGVCGPSGGPLPTCPP